MKRSDLERILRASKNATGETEFVVIGSQSILGSFPEAPGVLRQSTKRRRPPPTYSLLREVETCSRFRQAQDVLDLDVMVDL